MEKTLSALESGAPTCERSLSACLALGTWKKMGRTSALRSHQNLGLETAVKSGSEDNFFPITDFPKALILVQMRHCCFAVQCLQQSEVLFLGSVLTSAQNLVLFMHKHFWLHSCLNLYMYVFIPMCTPMYSPSGGRSPADAFSGGFISMRSFRAHFHSALTHRSLSLLFYFFFFLLLPNPRNSD